MKDTSEIFRLGRKEARRRKRLLWGSIKGWRVGRTRWGAWGPAKRITLSVSLSAAPRARPLKTPLL